MKQPNPGRQVLRIDSPEAASMISEKRARRFLECFLGQARSVSQVAGELGVDMSSVSYRVKQFIRLGLVEMVREVPRGGRAIKYYRTVADAFFVPFGVVPFAPGELSPGVSIEEYRLLQKSVENAWQQLWGRIKRLVITCPGEKRGLPLM